MIAGWSVDEDDNAVFDYSLTNDFGSNNLLRFSEGKI